MSTAQTLSDFASEFKNTDSGLDKVLQRLALIDSENTDKGLYQVSELIRDNMKNFSPNSLTKISDLQKKVIESMNNGNDYNTHVKTMKLVINRSLKKKRKLSLS